MKHIKKADNITIKAKSKSIQGVKAILDYLVTNHHISLSERTFNRYRKKCSLKIFSITERLITTTDDIDKWVSWLRNDDDKKRKQPSHDTKV